MATLSNSNRTHIVHKEVATVESRILSCQEAFVWKIHDFRTIWQNHSYLESLNFTFQTGKEICFPSTWRVSIKTLHLDVNNRTYYSLQCEKALNFNEKQSPDAPCFMSFDYQLADPFSHEALCSGSAPLVEVKLPWGDATRVGIPLLDRITNIEELPIADDCLNIYITCKLKSLVTSTVADKTELFEAQAILNLTKDIDTLLDDTSGDVTLISMDNKEYKAHKTILKARSRVFAAMFSPCWTEGQVNVVRLIDLSSKTIEVLLHFIYSGTLHQDWASEEVLDQLTYAADKYELLDLNKFLQTAL